MPFNLSGWELLLILGIGLLLFGSRLPMVGRNLGKGIVEFKKGISGVEDEVNRASQQTPPPATQYPGASQQQYGQQPQQPYPQQYQQLPPQQPPVQAAPGPVGTVSRADQVH